MIAHPLRGEADDQAAREYYADPNVRQRIREYCGIAPEAGTRCLFLRARSGQEVPDEGWDRSPPFPPAELDALLDRGLDVTRSLWDSESLLFHLDLDYLNPDRPDEAFTHPAETFFKLESTYRAAIEELAEFRLLTLQIATGEGYHLTGRIPLDGSLVRRLAALVPTPPRWHGTQAVRRPAWLDASVSELHARAVTGLGLVLEYLAQRIIRQAALHSTLPVVLNGTAVGAGSLGRECVSVDLTQFADPLDMRHLRCAFSVYRKPGVHSREPLPLLVAVPRNGADLAMFLEDGRGAVRARSLACDFRADIPESTGGLARVLDAYLRSPLAAFHREFQARSASPGRGAELRARLEPDRLPPCVAACLVAPNDLLLRPAHLQNLTRALRARDWPARDIADVVEALYGEDHGWGETWARSDSRARAEGYVRAFAGMIHAGLDRLTDFNCVSTQEKDMCPGGGCPFDLREDARALLDRGGT